MKGPIPGSNFWTCDFAYLRKHEHRHSQDSFEWLPFTVQYGLAHDRSFEENLKMNILWTIIIGFIIGLIARFIMPGRDSAGIIVTTGLGIIGAFVGSFLGQGLGFYNSGEPAGLVMSVLGALLVLFVYKKLAGTQSVEPR